MTPGMQVLMKQMEELRDRFCSDLFDRRDADAATAAMAVGGSVREVPSGAGGTGADDVHRYLSQDFLPHLPPDLTHERLSRTLDTRKLVDEVEFSFTHDRELPWLLPGVAPTGRQVTVLAMSLVRIRQNKIDAVRTLWDEAGLRRALGVDTLGATAHDISGRRPSSAA